MTPSENEIYEAVLSFRDHNRIISLGELFTIGPELNVGGDNYIWVHRNYNNDWVLWKEQDFDNYLNKTFIKKVDTKSSLSKPNNSVKCNLCEYFSLLGGICKIGQNSNNCTNFEEAK